MTTVLEHIIDQLSRVSGVSAIALGGSRSRGKAVADSDYDIGVYYHPGMLDTEELGRVMTMLDDERREGLLNSPGEWGPWVNGGGWLRVGGVPVDILLRDIARVESVLRDCVDGKITIDYQCGHPLGFVNAIYAAETHAACPLWQDADEPLSRLKAILCAEGDYPPRMRAALIQRFLWEAGFALDGARKPARRGDINYVLGTVFRTVTAWLEAIYALNGEYLMNEKGALLHAAELRLIPALMRERVEEGYSLFVKGQSAEALKLLDELHAEITSLTRA